MSCDAQRPDRRAIAKCITEISSNIDESLANELTGILLEGDPVDIEMDDKNVSSAYRALRKLGIDYEIVEWTRFLAVNQLSNILKAAMAVTIITK